MQKRAVIITSINAPSDSSAEAYAAKGDDVFVVGDRKTPHDAYQTPNSSVTYVGLEQQESQYAALSAALPWNHYSRKNIGYMHAIALGYSCIFETDDDNWPLEAYNQTPIPNPTTLLVVSGQTFVNPLPLFDSSTMLWPRGFPLQQLHKEPSFITQETRDCDTSLKIGIVQSLVRGDPDVDAICRLTQPVSIERLTFVDNKQVAFDRGCYVPANTQATLWLDRSVFYLLYVPCTVSFRFCDILKMYVAQRCLWQHGLRLCYTSPLVNQKRNEHDLMQDLDSEHSMHMQVPRLITALDSLQLQGTVDDLITVYTQLIDIGIVQKQELQPLREWVHLCKYHLSAAPEKKRDFSNVVLILVFNFSNCLDSLPVLLRLYSKHFKTVVVYADLPERCDWPNVHFLPLHKGYVTQRVFVDFCDRYKDLLQQSDGIMYAMDDCIFQPATFAEFDLGGIVMSSFGYQGPLDSHSGWNWDRPWGKQAIARMVQEHPEPADIEWCGGFSDYFYVPREAFCDQLIQFWQQCANYGVFLEIAIPTGLLWIAAQQGLLVHKLDKKEQLVLWDEQRLPLATKDFVVDALRRYAVVHPIKFGELPEREQWLLEAVGN